MVYHIFQDSHSILQQVPLLKPKICPLKRRRTYDISANPRQVKYPNNQGFCEGVRNMVFKYRSRSLENRAYKYLYLQAYIQVFRVYMYCNSFQHMYSFESSFLCIIHFTEY